MELMQSKQNDTSTSTLPADKLSELRQELEGKESENSKLAKKIEQLKAQISDVSKTVGDIDQKTSAYEKAAGAIGDQVKDLTEYVRTEKTMLKAALPANIVTDVENKKSAALQKLANLKTKLDTATTTAANADTAHGTAKNVTAAAQVAYKAIADLPDANAAILKDLTELRRAADKQGAANSLVRQYFLILVMEDRLGTIKALAPDDYKKQLNEAGSGLASAAGDQRYRQEHARGCGCDGKTSAE